MPGASQMKTWLAPRTYSGVGDGLGELASTPGDGIGEAASAAGNTAWPDIFGLSNLLCHWRCKSSGPSCRWAGRGCFAGSPAAAREGWGIMVASCCISLSLSACTCAESEVWLRTLVELVRTFAAAFSFSA